MPSADSAQYSFHMYRESLHDGTALMHMGAILDVINISTWTLKVLNLNVCLSKLNVPGNFLKLISFSHIVFRLTGNMTKKPVDAARGIFVDEIVLIPNGVKGFNSR